MTEAEARTLLNVGTHCTRAEIEQAFQRKQAQLQAKTVAGNPRHERLRALSELGRLPEARKILLNALHQATPGPSSQPPVSTGAPSQGQAMPRPGIALSGPHVAVAMSWVIAGVVMAFIALSCIRAVSGREPAQFRVFAAPWTNVEVDGQPLGASGQPKPYRVPSGRRMLRLERDGKVIQRRVRFSSDRPTIIRVQFDKGDIHVSQD